MSSGKLPQYGDMNFGDGKRDAFSRRHKEMVGPIRNNRGHPLKVLCQEN